jgi:hypothetical protein
MLRGPAAGASSSSSSSSSSSCGRAVLQMTCARRMPAGGRKHAPGVVAIVCMYVCVP